MQFGGTVFKLPLLGFIVCRQLRKPFIRNTPGHAVLIKPLEDSGQLGYALLGCVQFLFLGGVPALAPIHERNRKMPNASFDFFHHYYGSPIPFFQMAAVFFSSLLRYARPFWANFPVTFYNNRNVRSAKNGRKKTPRTFKKSVALQLGRYSIFISIM